MGLVENRQQVQEIVDLVDDDGSGVIEFGEFLSIIKGDTNSVSFLENLIAIEKNRWGSLVGSRRWSSSHLSVLQEAD